MTTSALFTSNFKRFAIRILLPFFLIVGVGAVVGTYFFEKYIVLAPHSSGAYKIARMLNESHPNEGVVLGSSISYSGIVIDSLPVAAFNYSMMGIKDDALLFMLEQELKKNKLTPILLHFNPNGLQKGIGDIAYYLPNATHPAVQSLLDKENRAYFALPFWRYYGYYLNYLVFMRNERAFQENKGSLLVDMPYNPDMWRFLKEKAHNQQGVKMANDSALAVKFEKLLASTQRRIVIYCNPHHPIWFINHQNPEALPTYLNTLSQKYTHVQVLNYQTQVLPDSFYTDAIHLNKKGAQYFSHLLKKDLDSLHIWKKAPSF